VSHAEEADYSPPASVRRQMTRDAPSTSTTHAEPDFSALELLATTAVELEELEAREQALQERREASDAAAPAEPNIIGADVDHPASSAVAETEHAVDVDMGIDARNVDVAQCSTSSSVDKMEGDMMMESEAPQQGDELSTSEPTTSGLVVISQPTAVTAAQQQKAFKLEFKENAPSPAKSNVQVLTAWTGHSEAPLGVLQPMGC